MLAHITAALADISDGRYSLGIRVGNSFDYDQIGVEADSRVARFEECVEILSRLLNDRSVDFERAHWTASNAELVLGPDDDRRPSIVVAAGGPQAMSVAARFGDAWNGWAPTDAASPVAADLIGLLDQTCEVVGRDPSSIGRTFDLGFDPLDIQGARTRSIEMLQHLAGLGADEVRCYAVSDDTHAARHEAIVALAAMMSEI